MKNFILSTFHFARNDSPEDGPNPEEAGVKRDIRDVVGLLAIAHLPNLAPEDSRCVTAMVGNGFTAAQLVRFRQIVERAIEERRGRMNDIKRGGIKQQEDYANLILADVAGIEKRWRQADAELVRLVANAEEIHLTGLEPNHKERAEAAKAEQDAAP